MDGNVSACANCGTTLSGPYCPECGQKDVKLQRPIAELLRDVLYETFDIDGRAARTAWTLLARPGVLTSRYLAGHRREYTPPVRLYLVVSIVFFLVVAWVVRQGFLFEVDADSAGEVRVLAEELPRLMFLFLPVFALLLKILYRRRFYFDHLIHALHLHTAAYVLLALLMPLEAFTTPGWLWTGLHGLLYAYLGGYLTLSLRRVYRGGWLATAARAAAIFFGYATILAVTLEFAAELNFAA